jgi:hypothetical protein
MKGAEKSHGQEPTVISLLLMLFILYMFSLLSRRFLYQCSIVDLLYGFNGTQIIQLWLLYIKRKLAPQAYGASAFSRLVYI